MAYPKRGDVVYVEGKLLRVRPWNPVMILPPTPAIVVASGIDPEGRVLVEVPLLDRFWANLYQIRYPDGTYADGQEAPCSK